MHVGGCFSLPGLPDKPHPFDSGQSVFRFIAKPLCFVDEALIERGNVLHCAAPFLRKAGAQLRSHHRCKPLTAR